MTTEFFLNLCYRCGLSRLDLEEMTIGMCIDFIYEYMELHKISTDSNHPKQSNVRQATQADYDAF